MDGSKVLAIILHGGIPWEKLVLATLDRKAVLVDEGSIELGGWRFHLVRLGSCAMAPFALAGVKAKVERVKEAVA